MKKKKDFKNKLKVYKKIKKIYNNNKITKFWKLKKVNYKVNIKNNN